MAFAEVAQRLIAALPGAVIVANPVGPFDTLAAGFVVAQLALADGPAERVVFSQRRAAPRRGDRAPRQRGRVLHRGRGTNGTLVVGPNSGHSLAEGELALAPGSSGWPLRTASASE